MAYEFRLPDIGEGVVEGEVVAWHIKEGDTVAEDQPLLEVMTDKATVVIPSPRPGKILKTYGKEGEIIKVGAVVVEIDTGASGASAPAPARVETPKAEDPKAEAPKAAPAPAKPVPPPVTAAPAASSSREVLAPPAVRRLARQMGVDIASVAASGPRGRVTKEDVERAAKGGGPAPTARAVQPGTEERIPFRGMRRKIAEKMHQSKSTAAHFSYVDEVDMTEMVALRSSLKEEAAAQGAKLTYLPFIIKALVPAFRQFPIVNSTLDEARQEMVLKHYYNVGISVDTEDGLVVPVVKRVETKSVVELAREIAALSEKARAKRLAVDDLQGGTFTITSVGNIGGMFATPIINFPEVAILGVNRIHERPVVRDGVVCIRQMMYLAISLDHRIVDGATGARFLNEVKKRLENPGLLLLESV